MASSKTLSILRYAAIIFFPIVILAGLASFYNDKLVIASNLKILQEHEMNRVAMQKHAIKNVFENIVSDLEIVSLHSDLKKILSHVNATESVKHQKNLGEEFLAFIHHKEVYDQLRVLNQQGMEIIRVEKTAESERLVPLGELQNQAGSPYFAAAIHGKPESVYVSPIALNVEHHQIEKPYKPVIQLSMSLANQEGKVGGVLVINYLGEHLFAIINKGSVNTSSVMQLIDSRGFWIKGSKVKDEWGDILDGRGDKGFRFDYPEAWRNIAKSESGQFINTKGMFTFVKINPFETHHRRGHAQTSYIPTQEAPLNMWILLSYVSPEALNQQVENEDSISYINQSILTLSLLILSLLIAQKRVEHTEDLHLIRQKDLRLRAVVDTALDGIVTINHKGIISSSNPAACKMFGYEKCEMLGQNIRMIVPAPDKESHDDYIDRYIETLEVRIVNNIREVDAEKKDGSIFPIELCVGAKELDGSWLFTGIMRDITERKALTDKLEKMAISDALTGVYNRGHFTMKLEEEFQRSQRYHLNLSLMMLDLDYFKAVNDAHGHPAGDAVLIALADQIQKSIRKIDILARYGGEEFAVIMPETDCDGAKIIAERIRKDIEMMVVNIDTHHIQKTVSIGVACLANKAIESADDLLITADDALYQAKHGGRNRVVVQKND